MTTKSSTPRTDKEAVYYSDECLEGATVVEITFARQLEQELNKANSQLAELQKDKERLVEWLIKNLSDLNYGKNEHGWFVQQTNPHDILSQRHKSITAAFDSAIKTKEGK